MWAIVNNSSVVEIVRRPKAITLNGVQHPASIFKLWSSEDLKAINIYEYKEINPEINTELFERTSENIIVNNDSGIVEVVYENTKKSLEDFVVVNTDGNEITIPGLKTIWLQRIKEKQNMLLSKTDWVFIRKADTGQEVPQDIQLYRNEVRLTANMIEDQVNTASTFEQFALLFNTPVDSNGVPTGNPPMYNWPIEV